MTHAAGSVDVAAQPSPGGAVVGNGQIRGDFAFADFRSHATDPSDPTRTLFTHVIVAVNMDQTQAPGGGWQSAPGIRVAIFVDGIRAGENSTTPVLHVESGSDAGYANLALDYGATRDLGAATLHGVFAGTNMLTGQPVEVAADLAWNATGEVVESKDHIHNVDPGSFVGIVHGTSSSRTADASGSVTLGGTNYTEALTHTGTIGTVRAGTHDVDLGAGQLVVQPSPALEGAATPERPTWGGLKARYR